MFNRNNSLLCTRWLVAAAFLWPSAGFAADLLAVRFGERSATETRVVLDSNGALKYDLAADSTGAGRLIVTLPATSAAAKAGKGLGCVASYSVTREDAATKIVIDLKSGAKIKAILSIPPSTANPLHRLAIDLVSAKPGDLVASIPAKKYETMAEVIADVAPAASGQAPPREAQSATPASLAGPPVIVIDAGHGGTDPGAAGPAGAQESAATLAAALALAEALRETSRYEIVMTRSEDTRVAHQERSRIARDAKADLFISLHADAHADAKVRGGSVYTLSDEGSERSAREALAQGNFSVFDYDISQTDPEVGGILYNLAQRRTENESDRFAEVLIEKLAGVTPLLNNTHRRGNFKVLLAPDVPAVLFELAFISNKQDERNLGSAVWRKRTMGAAAGAIDAYFRERAAARHASNNPA